MATRTRKAAPAAEKKTTRKAPAKKVVETEESGRVVAAALMDRKSPEFAEISERYQGWVTKWQDNGMAYAIDKAVKGLHRILGHNRGLFIVSTNDKRFIVGTISESGKSFKVDETFEDQTAAFEYYQSIRTGNYGGEKASKETPAPKKAAGKGRKAAPAAKAKRTRKAAAAETDDVDDLLD